MLGFFGVLFTLLMIVPCAIMCIGMLSCYDDGRAKSSRVEPIPFKKAA